MTHEDPVVLIRKSLSDEAEIAAARRFFPVIYRRTEVTHGNLVIPRYSALPFNREFELDVDAMGGKLINSNVEHSRLADLESWYYRLQGLTPRTWFDLSTANIHPGPFVLKGATNSKKQHFATHMYAASWAEAVKVHGRLTADGLIVDQKICIREYVPLRKLCDSVSPSGPPVTEEYRFFVFRGEVLCGGFYWSGYEDDIEEQVTPDCVPKEFLGDVIERVKDLANFFVVDVARTAKGDWIVIELNDGQQSGLCSIDPFLLYEGLRNGISRWQGGL